MHLAMGVPLRVATATSNLMIGITAAASAVIYLIRGGIDPYVAGPTAIGVFVGASVGSRIAHRIELRFLRCCSSSSCCTRPADAAAGRRMSGSPAGRTGIRAPHRPAADRRHLRRCRAAARSAWC